MTSVIERLQLLPGAFHGIDVMRSCGWTSKQTNEVLARWKNKGLINSLGKRLDVYSNNLKLAENERLPAMLLKLDTNALDLSHKVWSEKEWTTQYPTRDIVVSFKLVRDIIAEEVYLKHKPLRWLKVVYPGLNKKNTNNELYSLKPEWLLAEALFSNDKDLWLPEPDDLDFDAIKETTSLQEWNMAFNAMAGYYNKKYEIESNNVEDCYTNLYHQPSSNTPEYQ